MLRRSLIRLSQQLNMASLSTSGASCITALDRAACNRPLAAAPTVLSLASLPLDVRPPMIRHMSSHDTSRSGKDDTAEPPAADAAAAGPPPSPPSSLAPYSSVGGALDAWGAAMDAGDWEKAWDIFESQFPVDDPLEFPSLEDVLAIDPDAEERAERRRHEEVLQEEAARSRVRRVDDQGRSHGVGRRKTAVARVWLREGPGHVMINRRPFDSYFPSLPRRNDLLTPLMVAGALGQLDVMAAVEGGGAMGQAQALRHGIARALQEWDPSLRAVLKEAGLLTRDARVVERKKPGRKKARKSFAFVKR